MAAPTTLTFGNFTISLGDGADPEVFSAPCGFTSKSLKQTGASSSVVVPDCDDPEAAAWTQKNITSLSAQVSGSGILAEESLSTWRAWFLSAVSKNVRIALGADGDAYSGYYAGAAILTDFTVDASRESDGGRAKISVTIDNDGAWAWMDTD